MGRVTLELLRKRAEHNDGVLSTLKEITLQGQNLETIEVVGHVCRELQVLYLQNNVISRIEDVHHLKELRYLNLAVNNITRVENLQSCESLHKLDLTMNFVPTAALPGLASLAPLYNLRELHLLGNPCQRWQHYRQYVVAQLPQLTRLDGEDVTEEEREEAQKQATQLEAELTCHLDTAVAAELPEVATAGREDGGDGEVRRPWCPETRLLEHREQERLDREAEETRRVAQGQLLNGPVNKMEFRHNFPPLPQAGKQPSCGRKVGVLGVVPSSNKAGERVAQKNEGKWAFTLREVGGAVVLDVDLGRGVVTSEIRGEVHPSVVRMLVKGRLLQLEIAEEIDAEQSHLQRSKVTGNFVATMPRRHSTATERLSTARGTALLQPTVQISKADEARRHATQAVVKSCWTEDGDELPMLTA